MAGKVLVTVGGRSTTEVAGVTEKSSTDSPSSEPVALKSVQRSQKTAFDVIVNPLTVADTRDRLVLPFKAPAVGPVLELEQSNVSTLVHVPVARDVASVLY